MLVREKATPGQPCPLQQPYRCKAGVNGGEIVPVEDCINCDRYERE